MTASIIALIKDAPVTVAMFDHDMRYVAASREWSNVFFGGDRDLTGLLHYETYPGAMERWGWAHRRGLSGEVIHVEQDELGSELINYAAESK